MGDASQDLLDTFGPPKRFRIGIVRVKEGINGTLQEVQILQAPLAQFAQLIVAGRHKLPAHAALLDPVPSRTPQLVDSSAWTTLPPHLPAPLVAASVLLQLTVASSSTSWSSRVRTPAGESFQDGAQDLQHPACISAHTSAIGNTRSISRCLRTISNL
jgi:hypothetical protein